jgi:hypothetical protein
VLLAFCLIAQACIEFVKLEMNFLIVRVLVKRLLEDLNRSLLISRTSIGFAQQPIGSRQVWVNGKCDFKALDGFGVLFVVTKISPK